MGRFSASYIRFRCGKFWKERLVRFALLLAVPNALLTAAWKVYITKYPDSGLNVDSAALTTLCFFLAIFTAFRVSHAFGRLWEGAGAMFQIMADLYDVASTVLAFCRCSKAPKEDINDLRQILIRLFSILHVLVLADLSTRGDVQGDEVAMSYGLIDPFALDRGAVRALRESGSPVDLVFQWIQGILVHAQASGIIDVPSPLCTRVFQELNAAMVHFHDAMKIAEVPLPFPYSAAAEFVLMLQWIMTPLVVCSWSSGLTMCSCLSFVIIFSSWSLSCLAAEMENPFGIDQNDLFTKAAHEHFNRRLVLLLEHSNTKLPTLRKGEGQTSRVIRKGATLAHIRAEPVSLGELLNSKLMQNTHAPISAPVGGYSTVEARSISFTDDVEVQTLDREQEPPEPKREALNAEQPVDVRGPTVPLEAVSPSEVFSQIDHRLEAATVGSGGYSQQARCRDSHDDDAGRALRTRYRFRETDGGESSGQCFASGGVAAVETFGDGDRADQTGTLESSAVLLNACLAISCVTPPRDSQLSGPSVTLGASSHNLTL